MRRFMQGIGVGMIVSVIVISIAYEPIKPLSEYEIKKQAEDLGMISERTMLEKISEIENEIEVEENIDADGEKMDQTLKEIIITKGMTSEDVFELLIEENVIYSIEEIEIYFYKNNLTKKILPGIYKIQEGSDVETIGELITSY